MTASAVTPVFTALKAPKGIPDYYPPVSRSFAGVRDTLIRAADRAGYSPIELPLFEDTLGGLAVQCDSKLAPDQYLSNKLTADDLAKYGKTN